MQKKTLSAKLLASPHIVWSVLFIIAPLVMVAYYSFTNADGNFTLENIKALSDYKEVFLNSIWYGIVATAICLVIAYPTAYFIARSKARVQSTMIMLVMLPMWTSLIVRTYSIMSLIENTGIINTFLQKCGFEPIQMINTSGAVILGMVYDFLPFMILPIYSVLTKLDNKLVEAAHDLGADKITVLTKVILPLSRSGILSGITMVFVPSVSTFYISQKLGGGNFALVGEIIEGQFVTSNNFNLGAALSLVLMVLILICMAIMNRFSGDEEESGGGLMP